MSSKSKIEWLFPVPSAKFGIVDYILPTSYFVGVDFRKQLITASGRSQMRVGGKRRKHGHSSPEQNTQSGLIFLLLQIDNW